MIYSMTGYAAGNRDLGQAILSIEIKSINSRYLDIAFRIGDDLRQLEMRLREQISSAIRRGKIDCRVYLQSQPGAVRDSTPNPARLAQLAALEAAVRESLPAATPLSVADVLRWPGVLVDQQLDPQQLEAECLALMTALLDELLDSRAREGAKLAETIVSRVALMRALVAEVAPMLPPLLAEYRERLSARLREAVAALDEERIRQEVGVFAAKSDVAEELTRLATHLDELERIVAKGGAMGKRLDFLMQELNREANTLASKSVSADITKIALELKLLIEQIREQVQNIE
ncbi:Protein YicC [Georgfuchsia toluolica]|uniref:Protein YicC n=1 Tax=Georgfuchsia toluolica TaxID=424218 RepID=A0A916J5Z0_9PROT|nr:YicC/YloC family endoribonuclease [Georgfuchsia toluolica]CAG4884866.1 Protein YicC [Georgfuchsia toluolica]